MKLSAGELDRALAAELRPLYVILGEEPFTAFEAADAVRVQARRHGFDERVPLFVESGFDWNALAAAGANVSLFGGKRLLDLKLPGGKADAAGSRALIEYAERPPPDALLLVTAPGADRKTGNTAWAKAAARAGVLVECRPLPSARLPRWVAERLRGRGLGVPAEAPALIAEYAQGNPMAAAQAVERLALLARDGRADMGAVREAVVDEARYGLFECIDTALAGDGAAALRMLARLRETGTAPPLVLWNIARELRLLASWAWAQEHRGRTPEVWASRQRLIAAAARRRKAAGWQALLIDAARADLVIKGRAAGEPWTVLERLLLALAGIRTVAAA